MSSEHVDVTTEGTRATATVRGEFDMTATFTVEPALERLLQTPDLEVLTLDLGELRFIDSTGVGVILRVHDEAQRRGITFAIAPGPPEVQRVFEVAGLGDVLPFA